MRTPRVTVRLNTLIAIALCVTLAGCAATRPPAYPPLASERWDAGHDSRHDAPVEAEPEATDEDGAANEPPEVRSVRPGSGSFVNDAAARRAPPGAGAAGEVVFNFEGESIQAVIKAILGDLLQQNYVVAPGVQGTVTFSTAKPIRGDQALSILEMLLSWNNATLVWGDGRYTILPVDRAVSGNLTPRTGPLGAQRGYEVRAVPLQYISAIEAEKVLKPYARPNAVVNVDSARNMIVLGGTKAELENYLQTLSVFDVDWLAGMSVGIFPMQQAEATKAVGELEKIFGDSANTPMAGMFRFLPLEGVNAVMVITPQPRYLQTVEEWIERFDLGGAAASQRLYVYDVKNVKAIDLATTLSEIFGASGPSRSSSGGQSGDPLMPGVSPVEIRTLGAGGSPQLPPARPQANTGARGAPPKAGTGGAGGVDVPISGPVVDAAGGIALGNAEEVRISAVEESNALLVMATAGQWESIRRAIERLDTIPLQVQIEAQIIQVDLTDQLSFGVQWYFENAVGLAPEGALPGIDGVTTNGRGIWGDVFGQATSSGVGWTFAGVNAAAVIKALDSVSRVDVLSAPSLVVLNNKTATINVGQQIPVTSAVINTGTGTNTSASYTQYRQTGITLTVTPRVNPGGLVFMEVSQEDSTPGAADEAVGDNVSVNQRIIQSEIAVQSGQTVVLGGLIKQTDTVGKAGVPGLSRIPVIGGLFGSQSRSSGRQELLVLITPRVLQSAQDARDLTDEYKRKFRGLEPLRTRLDEAGVP